jgi:hypothetical protein
MEFEERFLKACQRREAREAQYEANLKAHDTADEGEVSELEQNRRSNQTREGTESRPSARFTNDRWKTWDPSPFEHPVRYADAGPWWLGRKGYEKLTTQWFELDEAGRQRIAAIEADIARERTPHRTSPNVAITGSQYSCSYGEDCRIEKEAKMVERMFSEDGLTAEERDSAYIAERLEREHDFLTDKVRIVLEELGHSVNRGEDFVLKAVGCLKEILALEKGKKRDDEPYGPAYTLGSQEKDGKVVTTLKQYYRCIRRYQQFEVDSQVIDMTKRLFAMMEKRDREAREHAIRQHEDEEQRLLSFLIQESKHYEEHVENGEKVRSDMLICLKKLVRIAARKGKDDDALVVGEETKTEDSESNDLTDLLTYGLQLYRWRLDENIIDGLEAEVDTEILDMARRLIERAASTERRESKDHQLSKPHMMVRYEVKRSDGSVERAEQVLDCVAANDDGSFTWSGENRTMNIESSITCHEEIFKDQPSWLERVAQSNQDQKPWVVITHAIKKNDGSVDLNEQSLGLEHFERKSDGSMVGIAMRCFRNGRVVRDYVERGTDESIICSTFLCSPSE